MATERASDDQIAAWRDRANDPIVCDWPPSQVRPIVEALIAERAAVHAQYKAGYSAARRFYGHRERGDDD